MIVHFYYYLVDQCNLGRPRSIELVSSYSFYWMLMKIYFLVTLFVIKSIHLALLFLKLHSTFSPVITQITSYSFNSTHL